jgi:hypothetical protein
MMHKELIIKQENIFRGKLEEYQFVLILNILLNRHLMKDSMKLRKLILLPNLLMKMIKKNISNFRKRSEK